MPVSSNTSKRPRRAYSRASGGLKRFFCYIVCFAVPLAYEAAVVLLVYPYRLASTAPDVAARLQASFPVLEGALAPYASAADTAAAASPAALALALRARDTQWLVYLGGLTIVAWIITLALQLGWRATHAKPVMAARATERAIRDYRLVMLVILAVNALGAAAVWLTGARFIAGRGLWDAVAYYPAYALNALAALCCFRLAAPPVLSGRGAFFRRL